VGAVSVAPFSAGVVVLGCEFVENIIYKGTNIFFVLWKVVKALLRCCDWLILRVSG
jgi:hypothetical protein